MLGPVLQFNVPRAGGAGSPYSIVLSWGNIMFSFTKMAAEHFCPLWSCRLILKGFNTLYLPANQIVLMVHNVIQPFLYDRKVFLLFFFVCFDGCCFQQDRYSPSPPPTDIRAASAGFSRLWLKPLSRAVVPSLNPQRSISPMPTSPRHKGTPAENQGSL